MIFRRKNFLQEAFSLQYIFMETFAMFFFMPNAPEAISEFQVLNASIVQI